MQRPKSCVMGINRRPIQSEGCVLTGLWRIDIETDFAASWSFGGKQGPFPIAQNCLHLFYAKIINAFRTRGSDPQRAVVQGTPGGI